MTAKDLIPTFTKYNVKEIVKHRCPNEYFPELKSLCDDYPLSIEICRICWQQTVEIDSDQDSRKE